jgi:DNA repair exonuclease SbcCD ATPase subunit
MKWQSEMRAEMDRLAREKKELSEQILEVESQLEWLRSERDEGITKLTAEKKVLQDRLHDAETQLSQLKSRKRDELKVSDYLTFGHLAPFLLLCSGYFQQNKKLMIFWYESS